MFHKIQNAFSLSTAGQWLNSERNRTFVRFLRRSLEVYAFSWSIFAFADVIFYRSVIDLGRRVVLKGIRLTTDLWFVFRKALIAFVNTFDGFFFWFGDNRFFGDLGVLFCNRFLNGGLFLGSASVTVSVSFTSLTSAVSAVVSLSSGTCSTCTVIAVCGGFTAATGV